MNYVDDDDIRAFLAESYENINQIENDIVDLEKASVSVDALSRIYRCLHTLKGNCGFFAFSKLEAITHASESILNQLRAGELIVNTEIATVLFQAIDSIRQILIQIEATNEEGSKDYSDLIHKIQSLSNSNQASAISNPRVESEENKVDVDDTLSVFTATNSQSLTPATETIRVDVQLLDTMMNLVGELILARNQLSKFASSFEDIYFAKISQNLDLISSELQFVVMKTRLQPINMIWQKLPRMVRDMEVASGKRVNLEIIGADTELDRSMIEFIKDPIMHLARNCIAHGIETPSVRASSGKPLEGKLYLRAFHEGDKVNIEVADDGSGIELERVKAKAQELGLINSLQAQSLSESEILNLIFLPGLSTSSEVTNISGRGVGMDIVKTNIERINGSIQVFSQPGQGTLFKIKIPLTLAIISVLIITCNQQRFTISQTNIQELVRLEGDLITESINIFYDIPVLRLRGHILPLIYLNQVLGFEEVAQDTVNIVVIHVEEYKFGLVVDSIIDVEDIVVKPLGKQLQNNSIFAGATILGDGKVALILDVVNIANKMGITPQMQHLSHPTLVEVEEALQMVLLFEGVTNARMGIFLTFAIRIEEFKSQNIKIVGGQQVLQYDNQIISLIDLNQVFLGTPRTFSPDELIQVIIVTINGQNYGLIVKQILDIVETPLSIKGIPTRPGIKMITTIQNQITEILDVENVISLVNPYLIHSKERIINS